MEIGTRRRPASASMTGSTRASSSSARHRLGAGPRRLAADVDEVRAVGLHLQRRVDRARRTSSAATRSANESGVTLRMPMTSGRSPEIGARRLIGSGNGVGAARREHESTVSSRQSAVRSRMRDCRLRTADCRLPIPAAAACSAPARSARAPSGAAAPRLRRRGRGRRARRPAAARRAAGRRRAACT